MVGVNYIPSGGGESFLLVGECSPYGRKLSSANDEDG